MTNFEIQRYYQNEPRINGVYSRDNLPNKIKYGPYVINTDSALILEQIGLLCMQLSNNVTYFDSFRVEHIPKEIEKFYRQ